MPQNCLLAYISMKLRENLSTPPFLDQPPFQLSTPFLQKFSIPSPFSQFWETPTPPLGRGVRAMLIIFTIPIQIPYYRLIFKAPYTKQRMSIKNRVFKPQSSICPVMLELLQLSLALDVNRIFSTQ